MAGEIPMINLHPCPFGDTEHYPRVDVHLEEESMRVTLWSASATCFQHHVRMEVVQPTEEEATAMLEKNWNNRFGIQCSRCGRKQVSQ